MTLSTVSGQSCIRPISGCDTWRSFRARPSLRRGPGLTVARAGRAPLQLGAGYQKRIVAEAPKVRGSLACTRLAVEPANTVLFSPSEAPSGW